MKLNGKEVWAPLTPDQVERYRFVNPRAIFPPTMHTHPYFDEKLMHSHNDGDKLHYHELEIRMSLGKVVKVPA